MNLPAPVEKIITSLGHAGFKAFLVGGWVRDFRLNQMPADHDIVTNCPPDTLKSMFRKDNPRMAGKTFPVFLINGVEVAPQRCPEENKLFPRTDLGARDFTINSMALDPVSGDIIDPFNGEKDLRQKIIRFTGTPDHRIMEDPLRMIRACRFKAAIKGEFFPETFQAIRKHAPLLSTSTAPERVRLEIMKAMVLGQPSVFFQALSDTDLLQYIFPCLNRCVGLDGGPHHGETVFEHCLMVGDALSPRDPLLRLAGFLHDAGKFDAARLENNKLSFKNHETMQQAIIKDLEALRFSTREVDFIKAMVRVHMRPLTEESTPRAVGRLLAFLAAHGVSHREFMRMRIADKAANLAKRPYTLSEIKIRLQKIHEAQALHGHREFTRAGLAINGSDIMTLINCGPGAHIGKILNQVFERVLEDPSLNTPDKLKSLVLDFM